MQTGTFMANSWHQGQCTAWDTYGSSNVHISSDAISIPLATTTISFSGEDPQCIMLKVCNIDSVTGKKTFEEPYVSTGTPIYYGLYNKEHTRLKYGLISRGGSVDIKNYPTARYVVITIEAAGTSVYNFSIRPDEESCIKSGNRCIASSAQFGITFYKWIYHTDGFPRYEDATVFPSPFEPPLPDIHWRIDPNYNNGFPYHNLLRGIPISKGAFQDASALAAVRVPITVKAIGSAAFAGTALQRVKIAADCAYEETSFPAGCVVEHYDDDRYEQLRDCEGRAILDCDARRIYVRKAENTNG